MALDLPTAADALGVVDLLPNVSFFKVGYQLFMTGGLQELLQTLRSQGKRIFLDLKIPGDISNTIDAVVEACVASKVTFLTVSESMPPAAIRAAADARASRNSLYPMLLTVPFLSSLDATDLVEMSGGRDLEMFIRSRARRALDNGCDGIIVSGDAIGACRRAFPHPTLIVSPGIRPAGASTNDHKRSATPAEAIRWGADFLVVGRPILRDADPRQAADRIVGEIGAALQSG